MLEYPDIVLPRLRYQFCPMCCSTLRWAVVNDDGLNRAMCGQCGWVHYPSNAMGVNVIVTTPSGIVAVLPPNAPSHAPAALPGGHVEYAETPEEAAQREAYEETGLRVEVVRCLGWYFNRSATYPGPMLSFMFETRAIGGQFVGSSEGQVAVFPADHFPAIAPDRTGSQRTMQAYLDLLLAQGG